MEGNQAGAVHPAGPPNAPMAPNAFARFFMAFLIFFRFLFDRSFAAAVLDLRAGGAAHLPLSESETADALSFASPASEKFACDQAPALHLLAILQREGRLVDFLEEDISTFSDTDVGGAARLVHEGCRKVLQNYVDLVPVRSEGDGASVIVAPGFDPSSVRLTGRISGEPPFTGALRHHGWWVADVRLPAPPEGQDSRVIHPAEVELA